MFKSFIKHTNFALSVMMVLAIIILLQFLPGHTIEGVKSDAANNNFMMSDRQIAENMTFTPEPDPKKVCNHPELNLLLGKTSPAANSLLVPIGLKYAIRAGMYLHVDAYESFKRMHEAAAQDSVTLVIISAFRDFNHQKRIWENKWNGRQVLDGNIRATDIHNLVERATEILKYSSMPGTSRHHWGSDIDLNSLDNVYFDSGEGLKIYNWLVEHAAEFGFCQPYTKIGQGRSGGYEEEKWHWSYMPVSSVFLDAIADSLTYQHIGGFDGWETAEKIDVIKNYMLEINDSCIE